MSEYPREAVQLKDGTEVILRHAVPGDVKPVLDFMKEIFETSDFLATQPGEFNPDPAEEMRSFEKAAREPATLLLVAAAGTEIIGLVDCSRQSIERRAHCASLLVFVKNEFRGTGLGTLLMNALIRWAKRVRGLERLELTVLSGNIPAVSLYKSLGFREEGRKTRAVRYGRDRYMDELLMALTL